jgi:hypothetical protein
MKRVKVAYQVALPTLLSNIHNVFHLSQLRKYVPDPTQIIEMDDVQVREKPTAEVFEGEKNTRRGDKLC